MQLAYYYYSLIQQYAAIANGLLNAKQDVPRLIMPLSNGHPVNGHNSAPSPGNYTVNKAN